MSERDATNPNEWAYLGLLRDVLNNGDRVPTRATLRSTGEKAEALSVFGRQVRYDLRTGFPLLTTKRVDFRAIAHELYWMVQGWESIGYLRANGVHIWDAWAGEDGDVGPLYGSQWRSWYDHENDEDIDQIAAIIDGIRAVKDDPSHPAARRLILSAWNVADLPFMALPPCHVLAQFHVRSGRLSCQFYQRSADCFLGVPFNVASYALLTHLLAHVCGLGVGDLIHSIGDAHLYSNHFGQAVAQLLRDPLPPPTLRIAGDFGTIDDWRPEMAALVGYACHPALRGEVAV